MIKDKFRYYLRYVKNNLIDLNKIYIEDLFLVLKLNN